MTECLADLAGKPTQMWGWDGCRGAVGGCEGWMVVVRRSNCVQVIDPAPSPFHALLPVSQALHLSFTCVPQMGENISKERPFQVLAANLFRIFSSLNFSALVADSFSHLISDETIIKSFFTF